MKSLSYFSTTYSVNYVCSLRNQAVSAEHKLLLTLRYYATGSLIAACSDFIGVHKSTGSRIIHAVSSELALLRPRFVNFPSTEAEIDNICQRFFTIAKFPRCVGAIDCTHVRIRSPGGPNAEVYRNRKQFFSINVQTVCDADLRIQNIVAHWQGSAHDSNIFRRSNIRRRFESGEFGNKVLVGDSGYGIRNYLITPLSNPTTHAEELFNEAQIRTRNPVERSYGVWKRRFPILSTGINTRIASAESIIVATAVLHNIAIHFREVEPYVTTEEERLINLTNFQANPLGTSNRANRPEQLMRNTLINYFAALC